MEYIKKVVVEHYRVPEALVLVVSQMGGSMETGVPNDKYLFRYYRHNSNDFAPFSKGGKTVVTLVLDDDTEVVGEAYCSMRDNFSYEVGRTIAQGRALKLYTDKLGG